MGRTGCEKKKGKEQAAGVRMVTGALWVFALLLFLGDPVSLQAQEANQSPKESGGKDRTTAWDTGAGVAALLDHPDVAPQETKEADTSPKPGSLVMADVQDVLNVREEPGTEAAIVGYLYADCGGDLLERKDGWTRLSSGDLTGWASDEYLLFGEQAQQAARDAGRLVATTTTDALRIRKAPALDAGVYDLLEKGAEYEVIDEDQLAFSDGITISDDWVALDFEGKTGYVSAAYVTVEFVVDHGETVEAVELRRQQQEQKEAQEQTKRAVEQQTAQATGVPTAEVSDETLLAALIQCEAGSDVYEGQVAVGAVVMNRVLSSAYPNTIRDVIYASGQFSPASSGKLARLIASGKIWDSCRQAALDAMSGVSPVGQATRFRRAGNREGIVVGQHVFW